MPVGPGREQRLYIGKRFTDVIVRADADWPAHVGAALTMHRAPVLSVRQHSLISRAAAMLPVSRQEDFVRRVHARLTGEPADAAVSTAVNMALDLAREEV
jgi:hypothetical protein